MPCPSIGSNVLNTVQNVKFSCFCSDLKQAIYLIHYYLRTLETIIFLTWENLTFQIFVKMKLIPILLFDAGGFKHK